MIEGPSGAGKTAIAEALEQQYGLKQIKSYTNRPRRSPDESSHVFLDEPDVETIKKQYPRRVAETVFDGHFYFSTHDDVDVADVYVISPEAVPLFKQNYTGKKRIKVVYVTVSEFLRRQRMLRRGDSADAVEQRIKHDQLAFSDAEADADIVVRNFVLSDSVGQIKAVLS